MPKESAERVGSGCFWGKENGEEFVLSDSVHIYDSDLFNGKEKMKGEGKEKMRRGKEREEER